MKRVAIITSSDTGYRGEREDLSGPVIKEIVEREGYEVVSMDILPDDQVMLAGKLQEIADSEKAELILTTGGTGFSERDVTPEATEEVIERKVPGIPEAIRAYSMTITKHAEPCDSRNPREDTDRKSSGQSESSTGKSGIYYRCTGTRA